MTVGLGVLSVLNIAADLLVVIFGGGDDGNKFHPLFGYTDPLNVTHDLIETLHLDEIFTDLSNIIHGMSEHFIDIDL